MTVEHSDSASARLAGRQRDLERLRGLVADPPPGALIMVVGEAGIGKTSLVNQLVAEHLDAGDHVLRGSADKLATARFAMWRRPLRDLGVAMPHVDPSVGAADQIDELAATIADSLATAPRRLIVLEDVHWADASSLEVLERVVDRLIGRSIAVVVTVRSGEPVTDPLPRLQRQSHCLVLAGVTPDDIALIALHQTGQELDPAVSLALHRRTGGNPLFVRELLASGGSRLSGTTGGLLMDALAALGSETADVLGALAIAGRAAPTTAIAHALSLSIDEIELHLQRSGDADILVSDPEGLWFRHDLLADAAANRYDPVARRALHGSLAEFWAESANLDDDGLEHARHLLAATPSIVALDAADNLIETAARLRRRRRAGDAADLLHRALQVWGTSPAPLPARLWMALGEARWDLAERPAAVQCFDRAAELASEADVATLTAIEVARQRYHNPIVPNPDARQRLADLDGQLARDDSVLRAALLGRRAMLALQPPADRREASAFVDAAVSMARRLDDPGALLTALCDRAFVVGGADDVRARQAIAEEILELARVSGRPEMAVAGHEWRFDGLLTGGDAVAATRALDEFEALATVAASPIWRYASSLKRSLLLLIHGDRDGAVGTSEESVRHFSTIVDPFELVGFELAIRAPAMILFGHPDRRVDELQAQMREMFDYVPSPFMQVRLAVGDLLVGDRASAHRRAKRWLADPLSAYEGPDPVGTLGLLALLADELQATEHAAVIADEVGEFSGLLCGGALLPADMLLSQLAILAGRVEEAIDLAQRALRLSRSMLSPVLEAHCLCRLAQAQAAGGHHAAAAAAAASAEGIAERIGIILGPSWSRRPSDRGSSRTNTADPVPTRTARLERDRDVWRLVCHQESGTLMHIAGMTQLARLLRSPGTEMSADDLNGSNGTTHTDLGPALDARAKREYRQRINELQAEVDEAEHWADPERAESARRELDALITELRRAVGLGGRDRPHGSGSERARVNVARNVRRAIAAIDKVAPQVAAHLTASVRTGHHCTYAPEPAARIDWTIDVGR